MGASPADRQTHERVVERFHDVIDSNLNQTHVRAAREAGLRYVTDAEPGIRRRSRGGKSSYEKSEGGRLADVETLSRIKSLVIPPAWRDVWIAPQSTAHLQATGRDVKGRKQYRYHPRFRATRDATKFERMLDFGRKLPDIRRRVKLDLALPGMPREKVLAGVVRLLERTLIRVGNDEYARTNLSYGLTTMRNRHASVSGSKVRFEFRGKSGVQHAIELDDPAIARLVRKCQELPGQQLFTYVEEDGTAAHVGSEEVNAYLRLITEEDFTAKDFRTWAGTVMMSAALHRLEEFTSETEAKKNITEAVAAVARVMGNTPAVCRKCYIHPAVVDAYLERKLRAPGGLSRPRHLRADEAVVLRLLKKAGAGGTAKTTPSRSARVRAN